MKIMSSVNPIQKYSLAPIYRDLPKVKQSFSPVKLCEFFHIYSSTRHERFRLINPISYALDSISRNCRFRFIENDAGKMLAGYVYKFRKNLRDEKSMFIDALARDKFAVSDDQSRKLMITLYDDIKKLAIKNNVKEITLFVFAKETRLRNNYANLGFVLDEKCEVPRAFLMRARVDEFLNNISYKMRKYKALQGINSLLNDSFFIKFDNPSKN